MPIQQTTPEEAQQLIGQGYRYIDVRTEEEFAAGHPATAVNIPVASPHPATGQMMMNPDFLAVTQAHFPKDARVIVGCQSGGRSQRAAEILAQAGYMHVANMQGGFGGMHDQMGRVVVPGWSGSGLPVCSNCGAANTYAGLHASKP